MHEVQWGYFNDAYDLIYPINALGRDLLCHIFMSRLLFIINLSIFLS